MKIHWARFSETLGQSGFERLGWIGFVLILSAYAALTAQALAATSPAYQAANMIGAICLGLSAAARGAVPIAWLNGIWFLIGMGGIVHSWLQI